MIPEDLLSTEDKARQVNNLFDCVDTINYVLSKNTVDQDTKDTVYRNVVHLENMLKYNYVQNSGVDLQPIHDAIANGKTWLTENNYGT
jgi:hypothetical protein